MSRDLFNQDEHQRIIPVDLKSEMETAYIDYAMSVIVSRALPDARDGLKPSQRRILYAMEKLGLSGNKYRKCAKICGDTSGDYHPHGETTIYPTLVRMVPDWLMRYPLVKGQGNFGSIDGDGAAAMRYTEARLTKASASMMEELDKETVDFVPNYDATKEEPTVLPAKFPNLLVNGTSGIAVGMATNMAPHNAQEVIDGLCAYIDDPDISIDDLMKHIKAPDFPTGGIIYGYEGVRKAFHTGKGRIVMRGKATIETNKNGRSQIIVTEIPYIVTKSVMIEKTAQLINEKKLEGIADLRDESDREGLRVVYDLKKDAIPTIVLNHLFKKTQLQSSFSVNNVALIHGKPKTLNLKDLVKAFVDHRHDVITRRTQYEHRQASHKLHLLEGYLIVLNHLDAVIKLIKESKDPHAAREELMKSYSLSEIQAKEVLQMRLQRLTGMEREKIVKEHAAVKKLKEHLEEILAKEAIRMQILKDELLEIKEKYKEPRRSRIEHDAEDFVMEDMIPNEKMVITVSQQGYIKRSPLAAYRKQHRGGVGSKGVATKKEDFTKHLFVASAHDTLLIFTTSGYVFWKKVYEVPEGGKNTQGRAIQNLIAIPSGDKIQSILRVENLDKESYIKDKSIVFCTEKGIVKKTSLSEYTRPRSNGIRAIKTQEGDKLLEVHLTTGKNHLIIALRSGKAIHFEEKEVRNMGRVATGVRGIRLAGEDDKVVGMASVLPEDDVSLLVVSEKGYGKRSRLDAYRITHRGGKGVKTIEITNKTGRLVAMKAVKPKDQLMLITTSGITLRTGLKSMRIMSRATQGVRVVRLRKEDQIAALDIINDESEEFLDQEDTKKS